MNAREALATVESACDLAASLQDSIAGGQCPGCDEERARVDEAIAVLRECVDAAQVPADTSADDESCLQQIVITTPSGNGYDVPDWKKTFEVRDYFRSRLAPRRVSREWLYQTAGELSTFRFSNQHPEAALTWLGNMLRSLGIEVADV